MNSTRKLFSSPLSIGLALAALCACVLLLASSPARAQAVTVYAVFDVDAEVSTCRTVLNGAAPVDVVAVVDNVRGVAAKNFRVCLVNVSGVPDGANVVSAAPYDATWGVTGAGVQLPFNRPPAGGSSGVGSGRLSR
jgi:hypothetical protein